MSDGDALAIILGVLLWVAALVFVLMGIWLPSWQWAATGGIALVIGTIIAAMGANR